MANGDTAGALVFGHANARRQVDELAQPRLYCCKCNCPDAPSVPEALTALLPVAALGMGLVLLAHPALYPWSDPARGGESLTLFQGVWLTRPFFLLRSVVYLVLWIALAFAIVRVSRRQDQTGAVSLTARNACLSAIFLVVFAGTCWLACTDWIMSLEPHWSSTIFGVYNFAGIFLSALAAVCVAAIGLYWQGPFRNVLTWRHLHDLGTLLFGFSSFWMYIWFCQYLLIWYVNNPEETVYFWRRQQPGWQAIFLLIASVKGVFLQCRSLLVIRPPPRRGGGVGTS